MKREDFNFIAKFIADKVGIKLEASDEERWSADVKNMVIKYPKSIEHFSHSDLSLLIHESSHLRFTKLDGKFFKESVELIDSYGKSGKQVMDLINALEDIRVDQKICKIYRGAKVYLSHTYNSRLESITDTLFSDMWVNPKLYKQGWGEKKYYQYCYSACLTDPELIDKDLLDYFINEFVSEDVKVALKRSNPCIHKVGKLKSVNEVLELIMKDLLPLYLPFLDDYNEKDEQDKREQHKKMQELLKKLQQLIKGAMKREMERQEQRKKEEKDGKEGKDKGKGKGDKDSDVMIELKKNERDEEAEKSENAFCKSGGGVYEKDMFSPKMFSSNGGLSKDQLEEFVRLMLPKTKKSISILKDLEFERYQGGFLSGNIDERRIKKLFVGSNRVFKRKVDLQNDDKDMAVAVLVDESGSMTDFSKSKNACKAVGVLAKALSLSKKSFAVYGFNSYFHTHKDWGKKLDMNELLKVDGNAYGGGTAYNNDGYAIWKTTELLRKRPEKNKILIVFSDGLPAPWSDLSPEGINYRSYDLKEEVEKAEKVVKVYSFGISSSAVAKFYKTYKIINDATELPAEMIKIFKENSGKRIR